MFAVIRTGGKQYKVAKNDVIRVERLPGVAGDLVELDEVLLLGDGDRVSIGAPLVDGACVGAALLAQGRGDKVLVFKKKRRNNYRRKNGHRQDLTVLRITEILTGGQRPDKALAVAAITPKAEAPAKPAAKKAAKPKAPAKKAEAAGKKPAAKKAAKPKPAPPKAAQKKAAPKAKKTSKE